MMRVNYLKYLHHVVDTTFDSVDCEQEMEEILVIESEMWRKRANKVHVSSCDIPLPEGKQLWHACRYQQYETYLNGDTLRKLKRLVEDAEYERAKRKRDKHESWVKWVTALAAIVGAVTGVYLALRK